MPPVNWQGRVTYPTDTTIGGGNYGQNIAHPSAMIQAEDILLDHFLAGGDWSSVPQLEPQQGPPPFSSSFSSSTMASSLHVPSSSLSCSLSNLDLAPAPSSVQIPQRIPHDHQVHHAEMQSALSEVSKLSYHGDHSFPAEGSIRKPSNMEKSVSSPSRGKRKSSINARHQESTLPSSSSFCATEKRKSTSDVIEKVKVEEGSGANGNPADLKPGEAFETRYICPHIGCHKHFSTGGHARRHSRIHASLNPFECPHEGCTARFTRRDNCTQHQRAHHSHQLPAHRTHPANV